MRNAFRLLVQKAERRNILRDLDIDRSKIILRILEECGYRKWEVSASNYGLEMGYDGWKTFPRYFHENCWMLPPIISDHYFTICRSQWPSGLRRGSAAGRLLGLRVRIPPRAWLCVCCECCVFVRLRSLRRADHSSRGVLQTVVRPCVWSRNLKTEEAKTRKWVVKASRIIIIIIIIILFTNLIAIRLSTNCAVAKVSVQSPVSNTVVKKNGQSFLTSLASINYLIKNIHRVSMHEIESFK